MADKQFMIDVLGILKEISSILNKVCDRFEEKNIMVKISCLRVLKTYISSKPVNSKFLYPHVLLVKNTKTAKNIKISFLTQPFSKE